MTAPPVGGFFELELPAQKSLPYEGGLAFQSARAAFLALLKAGRPKRVWVPHYICSTMLGSLQQAGIEPVFYDIDERLYLAEKLPLLRGDWLLYVNYFGIRSSYARSLLHAYGPENVVIDASQALFSAPCDCLATVYSPRKFLGVPDGGLLYSSLSVDEPNVVDTGSFERSISLLKRHAFSPEAAYPEHQAAEQTLFWQEPRKMSILTRRILESVDYEEVKRIRGRNFRYLHNALMQHNELEIDPDAVEGALCYPLMTSHAGLRDALIGRRIFIPTYWKDVLDHASPSSWEASLVRRLVPLPCDQRYEQAEMQMVVDACLEYFDQEKRKAQKWDADSSAAKTVVV